MNDLISRQTVFDIVDDLRDQMTVVGYWSMVERVKALPSATCGNLEKPEIPQHSEGEAADCNLDCISRQMLLEYIHGEPVGKLLCDKYNLDGLIEQFPSAQPERTDCTECNEYDNEEKTCPHYCEVMRSTADGLQVEAYCKKRKLPSARPEIIHCRECQHHRRDNTGCYYCVRKEYGYGWGLNDFCSDAERRTDEAD